MRDLALYWRPGFSPHYKINEVDKKELQAFLIEAFTKWGLPQYIKVDNGSPFGSPQYATIPPIALWLIALGIKMIWTRPHMPTDNAKVERMQGITGRWAEIKSCLTTMELQSKLNEVCLIQREKYRIPRSGYKRRKEIYPMLYENPRKYSEDVFDINTLYQYLQTVSFVRRLTRRAIFSFYDHKVCVGCGKDYGNQVVIKLDLEEKQWKVFGQKGTIIGAFPLDWFTPESIKNFTLRKRCQINAKLSVAGKS